MEIEPLVTKHLAQMRLANQRPLTVYARERVLVRLTAWAQGPILYLTAEQLGAYQVWRSEGDEQTDPIGASSMRVEVSHLRQFYRWAVREGLRSDDPTVHLIYPKRKDYGPRPLADAAFAVALENAEPDIAAMLGLARYTGLRACEIARLDWRDVHLGTKTPSLTVREGKGGYTRTVRLNEPIIEILRALPQRSGPVIRRADGRDGYNTASRVSQRSAAFLHEHAGTERGEAIHALRHTYGTKGFRGTKNLRAVQEEMGHRSVATTQIYTGVSDEARAGVAEAVASLDLDETA